MKEIYIFDHKKRLRYQQGNLVVYNQKREVELKIKISRIKSINIFGNSQISTQTLKALAINHKPIHYYTYYGKYLFSLYEPHLENYQRQAQQFEALQNNSFKIQLAQRIIGNKVNLQKNLLKAYDEEEIIFEREYNRFESYIEKINQADAIERIIGYEGTAAKSYFYNLSFIVDDAFRFRRRSKRPPLDPFNSMLSFGYHILYGYLHGAVVKGGLNLGFGAIHKNKQRHAALVSDLIEEWRPILIDDTVLQLINQEKIDKKDFLIKKNQAVILKNETRKLFMKTLRNRMLEGHYYFTVDNSRYSFLSAVDMQINSLKRAFDHQDASYYHVIGESKKNYV